jgi:hypothetical protein
MSKRTIYIPENGEPAKPYCRCPFCGIMTTISPIKWTINDWIAKCDNSKCGRTFYAKVDYTGSVGNELNFDVIETYPKFVPDRHESVPELVWKDYLEACRCFDVEAYKATVVMCRRMLQNVCRDRGAKKKNAKGDWISLRNQIKEAFPEKDYSLIHSIADKVKYFGDYGAHPQDDNIDDVSQDASKSILDFSNRILEIAYIVPWGLKNLQNSEK